VCSVFIGRSQDPVRTDPREIMAWRWIVPEALQAELAAEADKFTPWFKMEWARIWRDHRSTVLSLSKSS
jgi:isopentenyl-diphosphate delta-isomerase